MSRRTWKCWLGASGLGHREHCRKAKCWEGARSFQRNESVSVGLKSWEQVKGWHKTKLKKQARGRSCRTIFRTLDVIRALAECNVPSRSPGNRLKLQILKPWLLSIYSLTSGILANWLSKLKKKKIPGWSVCLYLWWKYSLHVWFQVTHVMLQKRRVARADTSWLLFTTIL